MKRLNYKGIIFERFMFENSEGCIDETTQKTDLTEFSDGWSYVCPYCIKEKDLYWETDTKPKEIKQAINVISFGNYPEEFKCCIEGCSNMDAYDIILKAEECKIMGN